MNDLIQMEMIEPPTGQDMVHNNLDLIEQMMHTPHYLVLILAKLEYPELISMRQTDTQIRSACQQSDTWIQLVHIRFPHRVEKPPQIQSWRQYYLRLLLGHPIRKAQNFQMSMNGIVDHLSLEECDEDIGIEGEPDSPMDLASCDQIDKEEMLDRLTTRVYQLGLDRKLQKGDAIWLTGVKWYVERSGRVFWDGSSVILPRHDDEGSFYLPDEFHIPADFPPNHFDDVGSLDGKEVDSFSFDPIPIRDQLIKNLVNQPFHDFGIVYTFYQFDDQKYTLIFYSENRKRGSFDLVEWINSGTHYVSDKTTFRGLVTDSTLSRDFREMVLSIFSDLSESEKDHLIFFDT